MRLIITLAALLASAALEASAEPQPEFSREQMWRYGGYPPGVGPPQSFINHPLLDSGPLSWLNQSIAHLLAAGGSPSTSSAGSGPAHGEDQRNREELDRELRLNPNYRNNWVMPPSNFLPNRR